MQNGRRSRSVVQKRPKVGAISDGYMTQLIQLRCWVLSRIVGSNTYYCNAADGCRDFAKWTIRRGVGRALTDAQLCCPHVSTWAVSLTWILSPGPVSLLKQWSPDWGAHTSQVYTHYAVCTRIKLKTHFPVTSHRHWLTDCFRPSFASVYHHPWLFW